MHLVISIFIFLTYVVQASEQDWVLSASTNISHLNLTHQENNTLYFQNSSGNELYQFSAEQDSLTLIKKTTHAGLFFKIQDTFLHLDNSGQFSIEGSYIEHQNLSKTSPSNFIGRMSNKLYFFASNKIQEYIFTDTTLTYQEIEVEANRILISGNTFFKFNKNNSSGFYNYVFTEKLDQLSSTETLSSTLPTNYHLENIIKSDQEYFFLTVKTNNSYSFYSINSSEINSIELKSKNIQTIHFHHYFNCLLAFYSDNEKSYISTLKNYQWEHYNLTQNFLNSITFFNNTDNFLVCLGPSQKLTQHNPNLIFGLNHIAATPDYQQTKLIWNHHPIHKNYTILYNNTEIHSTEHNSYIYPSQIQQEDTFQLVTNTNGFKNSLTWTYQTSEKSNIEYYLPKYENTVSLSLWSFPAHTSIIDDKEEPLLDYLERYLGNDYNPSIWKIGTFLPASNNYIEGKDLESLDNTSGYWLASQFHLSFTIQYPEPTNEYHLYLLEPGWNLLGSYYSNSTLTSSIIIEDAYEWSYSILENSKNPPTQQHFWEWNNGEYQATTTMNLSKGYWLKNNRQTRLILKLINSRQKGVNHILTKSSTEKPPIPPSFSNPNSITPNSGGGGCFFK